MPHESDVRHWLRRSRVPDNDADDLIQEAYCRMAALDATDHITHPASYFFQIVRNLLLEQLRRAKVVRFETAIELDSMAGGEDLSPERIVAGRRELARVQGLIAGLPDRCRRVFELRKLHGVSQREIARMLGVSESVVENDGVKGLRMIIEALRQADAPAVQIRKEQDERPRNRR